MTTDDTARAIEAWEAPTADTAPLASEALRVDVDGFEGPLDLLLALARTQKVDLAKISVVALVDQYLTFIDDLKSLRLEIAADYLVMAAWLAFLKSRLLIPREAKSEDQSTAEELAQRLAFRLMRLQAMRHAAAQLMTRNRLGRDVFPRGLAEGVKTIRDTQHTAQIYDLLAPMPTCAAAPSKSATSLRPAEAGPSRKPVHASKAWSANRSACGSNSTCFSKNTCPSKLPILLPAPRPTRAR